MHPSTAGDKTDRSRRRILAAQNISRRCLVCGADNPYGLHASFTDMSLSIEDIVDSGDDVWVRSLGRGVNTRPIMGRPPTGKDFAIEIIDVIRFREGKMIAHWGVADRLGMLQQLGMLEKARRETA